jgi:hypothetical protein
MVTSLSGAVPGAGLQRDIRSGRGRPTAFLTISVMNIVSAILIHQSGVALIV